MLVYYGALLVPFRITTYDVQDATNRLHTKMVFEMDSFELEAKKSLDSYYHSGLILGQSTVTNCSYESTPPDCETLMVIVRVLV